ncbi:hypothetical protein G5B47_02745 [Paenibacillus sp. 7124]|uniref:Import inner membrane translocase subunit Tim44 n=1 Tax=Paenibacillus apii TaxID=1850370 RepID=A0A6M1PDK6_9BACL|nr:hypothetical protein [Paenibacillus apii]NGM81327.1 hypothetical protein [Paenibacillus apii]
MKFLKSAMMIVMAFTLFFVAAAPDYADARRGGGGFKSGRQGYTTTPNKAPQSNVSKSDGTKGTTAGTTAGTTNRGFFSGGSFMKGMMIGGLAGLLFGGLFGNMGFFGNLLGFAVNLLAIYLVVMLVLSLFRRRRRHNYKERDGRY